MGEERPAESEEQEELVASETASTAEPGKLGPVVDLECLLASSDALPSAREPLLSFRSSFTEPAHVTDAQVVVLREEILRLSEGSGEVTYGVLCRDDRVTEIFDKLLATLKYARRQGVLTFQGQLLMMGHHDDSVIRLLDAGDDGLGFEAPIPTVAPFSGPSLRSPNGAVGGGASLLPVLGSLAEEAPLDECGLDDSAHDAATSSPFAAMSTPAEEGASVNAVPKGIDFPALEVPVPASPESPKAAGRPKAACEVGAPEEARPATEALRLSEAPARVGPQAEAEPAASVLEASAAVSAAPVKVAAALPTSASRSPSDAASHSSVRASSNPAPWRHEGSRPSLGSVPQEERQKPTAPTQSAVGRIAAFEGFSERLNAFNDSTGWNNGRSWSRRPLPESAVATWSGGTGGGGSSSGRGVAGDAKAGAGAVNGPVPSLGLGTRVQAAVAAASPPQMSARTLARASSAPTVGASARKDNSKWKVDTSYVAICKGGISDLARREDGNTSLGSHQKECPDYSEPAAVKYSYEALRGSANRPGKVDPLRKEEYLEETEFRSVFGMGPAEFVKLPKWRRQDLKKLKDLF